MKRAKKEQKVVKIKCNKYKRAVARHYFMENRFCRSLIGSISVKSTPDDWEYLFKKFFLYTFEKKLLNQEMYRFF